MGVLLQAFYWDCPGEENRPGQWWSYVATKTAGLRAAGFTALWLPPGSKGGNVGGMSMGYDPYDYYDYGDFDQKGSVKTWFGNRAELTNLLQGAHLVGLQAYADVVLNHNNGADAQEKTRSTEFRAGRGSSRPAAASRATGAAFILRRMSAGTASPSATCRTCVIATRRCTSRCWSMPGA